MQRQTPDLKFEHDRSLVFQPFDGLSANVGAPAPARKPNR
jgi:hypothetical protein